jgi:DNA-binding MurR/RpiR family transcriptional regulator
MTDSRGHGDKLSRKQDDAIAALLSTSSIKDAAKACGVSDASLWRWLQLPGFQTAYRAARRKVVERAVSELQGACGEAVETLKRNLTCENPGIEIRAAQIVLEQAIKGVELIELTERIERLETMLESQEKGKKKWGT